MARKRVVNKITNLFALHSNSDRVLVAGYLPHQYTFRPTFRPTWFESQQLSFLYIIPEMHKHVDISTGEAIRPIGTDFI